MMQLDVASYRRVAERWASKDEDINPSMAAVLMLQMCSELERLQKADYEFQEKLADGITDAFLERRWIPVSERLPEEGVMVLGYDKQDGVTLTINAGVGRSGQRIWFGCSPNAGEYEDAKRYSEPTHWMPLPEPPKAK